MMELIVSQGRIGDRGAGMIEGAARTARALHERYGVEPRYVGTPAGPRDDDWTVSLAAAEETLSGLAAAVSASVAAGRRTVLAANTCSASLATLPAAVRAFPDCVVLWIDAHGDFNTPDTTESGYLGGMALAGACGLWESGHGAGVDPGRVVLVGARDLDPPERELLDKAGVRILAPAEATGKRVAAAAGGARVWAHIDWDVLEPGTVPADYHVPEGLPPHRIREILEAIPAGDVLGLELAEFAATGDESVDARATESIMDMIAPVFATAAVR
ncbi:arginase family protein [Amycolatopsis sp. VS8301801F10]|uniref:arginase family protein n=1 Tax=Amycolatopsis sp. VS8301801F10 TaxID=2652442 RepID=UPI0038FC6985